MSYEARFLSEMSEQGKALVAKTLQVWREFLLDLRPHPGPFEQHMILTDIIETAQDMGDLPSNWNRFMTRGCHINMAHSAGHPLYIYTKMARVTLLGFIGIGHPRHWVGTKVHVKEGVIGGNVTVPVQFLEYMKERATLELSEPEKLSARQLEVIDKTYRKDPERAANSETLWALDHDVRAFGEDSVFGQTCSRKKDPVNRVRDGL